MSPGTRCLIQFSPKAARIRSSMKRLSWDFKPLEAVMRVVRAFKPGFVRVFVAFVGWPVEFQQRGRRGGQSRQCSSLFECCCGKVGQPQIQSAAFVESRPGGDVRKNIARPVDCDTPVAQVKPQPLGEIEIKRRQVA